MRYLCAQCSFDLQEYGRAEEMLLKECRMNYQRLTTLRGSAGGSDSSAILPMDEWIVQTTVRACVRFGVGKEL